MNFIDVKIDINEIITWVFRKSTYNNSIIHRISNLTVGHKINTYYYRSINKVYKYTQNDKTILAKELKTKINLQQTKLDFVSFLIEKINN